MDSKATGAAPKRKYDSDETKRRLLRAALDVFAKSGFDAATTRMIAKKAKVNDSLIHRYFKSKQGLFIALYQRFHQNFVGELPYEPCPTMEGEIRAFFQFRMELSHRERKFLKLGLARAIVDPKTSEEVSQLHRKFPSNLHKRLEELKRQGKIRSDIEVEHLTVMISAIGFAMSMFRDIIFKYDDTIVQKVLDVSAEIIARGVTPPYPTNEGKVKN